MDVPRWGLSVYFLPNTFNSRVKFKAFERIQLGSLSQNKAQIPMDVEQQDLEVIS
jgi:hypothetical protein